MSCKKNNLNSINKIFLYKCFFMLYTVFLATEFSRMKSFTLIKVAIFGCGLIIFFYEVYKTKGQYLMKNRLLLLFMIFNTITFIINSGKSENFKFYLITLIQIFILTSIDENKNIETIKKELKKINFIFIVITLFLTMIGLVMYIFNFQIGSLFITDPTRTDLIKGIYVISTSAGLICYLSLAVTIGSLVAERNKIRNKKAILALYMANILIQGYGLILSGARGSLISFIIFVICLVFLFILNTKIRVGIIMTLISLVLCSPLYSKYISNIDFLNKDTSGNFFSGRLILWENGYENSFKNYKLFGPGPGNMIEVTKSLTDTYLPGIDGGRLHNAYLDVLCSNGILGFLAFITFILVLIVLMYKNSFNNMIEKEDRIYIKVIFAFITSILVINIVESIMIYVLSTAGAMFWIYIGYGKSFEKNIKD